MQNQFPNCVTLKKIGGKIFFSSKVDNKFMSICIQSSHFWHTQTKFFSWTFTSLFICKSCLTRILTSSKDLGLESITIGRDWHHWPVAFCVRSWFRFFGHRQSCFCRCSRRRNLISISWVTYLQILSSVYPRVETVKTNSIIFMVSGFLQIQCASMKNQLP